MSIDTRSIAFAILTDGLVEAARQLVYQLPPVAEIRAQIQDARARVDLLEDRVDALEEAERFDRAMASILTSLEHAIVIRTEVRVEELS